MGWQIEAVADPTDGAQWIAHFTLAVNIQSSRVIFSPIQTPPFMEYLKRHLVVEMDIYENFPFSDRAADFHSSVHWLSIWMHDA